MRSIRSGCLKTTRENQRGISPLSGVFCVFFIVFLFTTPGMSTNLDSMTTDWGTLYFAPKHQNLARSTADEIVFTMGRMEKVLSLKRQKPFQVVIAPDASTYQKMSGQLPPWSGGATSYTYNRIILKSPDLGKTNIWDYDETLRHEVAHMILGQNINPHRLPRWFNEGIAMAAAEQHSMKQMYLLSQAVIRNDVIPLKKLEQMLTFNPAMASLGYAESYSAVQYIQSEFPANTLPNVLNRMRKSEESYAEAFQEVAGVSQFYFEWHWREQLKAKYHWITMFSSDTFLWILFPILALLGYGVIQWRNRRKMKKWQEEEDRIDKHSDWDFEYLPDEDEQWRGDIH